MLFCIIFLNIGIYLVTFVETLENSLSLSVEPGVDFYRIFASENRSIFVQELVKKFIIFNSKNERKITARFGDFSSSTILVPTSSDFSVQLHTDRHVFLVPTVSNSIVVNTLCEFFYLKSHMSFLDEKFCCLVELHLNSDLRANPTASCQMRLGQRPSFCFTPLIIPDTADLPSIVVLTATVHRQQSGVCTVTTPLKATQTDSPIYATSQPVTLSFSSRPPLIWQLADYSDTKLLLGLPIHSSRLRENIRIALRIISAQAPAVTQIIRIQCIIDDRINVIEIIPNSPIVTILSNYSFSNSTHSVHNIELQLLPGRDRELFALNATLTGDSVSNAGESFSPTLQCCLKQTFDNKQRNTYCGREAKIVTLPSEINSMIIIPALKPSENMFSIYNTAKVSLSRDNIKVYGVVNYRDRSVSLVSEQVKISVMDLSRVNISDNRTQKADIDMQYQNIVNPWSIQLSMYDCRSTVLSPTKMWIADSWRLVLSDDVLRPIKNWLVPKSQTDGTTCAPRYKVARLKILCRLYMLDESGQKHYAGSDTFQSGNQPFIDVTESTSISQFRIIPANVISVEKSQDGHFLVTANEISQSTSIELLSPESSQIVTSVQVSVQHDLTSLYIVDLIVHCVDSLTLNQRNFSSKTMPMSTDYESITVSMSMDTQSLPCYLLVFLVFSDKSIERVSSFDHTHYQMHLVNSHSRPMSSTPITDGQLVTVKWTKNANISLFESSVCSEPKLIFSKKMNWGVIVPLSDMYSVTHIPLLSHAQVATNQIKWQINNNTTESPTNHLLQTSLYATFAILAFFFLCLILYKIFCIKPRSHHQSTAPICYISDSGFLNDQNKVQIIRHSNSKTFSSLGKCSTNCIKNSNNKSHSNEPYPPLLPPPGPIAANYDLTLNDPICCDSAVDSGIELGKLSNYSSNTNPSNDLCCSTDQHMSTSLTDDNPYRQPPPFASSLFGYYAHKEIMDSIHSYNDNAKLKSISNLRPPQW